MAGITASKITDSGKIQEGMSCFWQLLAVRHTLQTRLVQLTERVLSSRLPIIEIKHTAKAFTTLNWLIR